ncbi:hypothetical protein [Mucisphaera sp.]|uniref:hypothetical protein n=1 Tax=Mucisphaera sp. TaxID=2913024 RepID=UPI003D0E621E
MAKGQGLSRHQEKIVKRYYEHRDTIAFTKLQEIASELYLADTPAKSKKLWAAAATHLKSAGATPADIEQVTQAADPAKLATLITRLSRS